jgi:hypothetical protein
LAQSPFRYDLDLGHIVFFLNNFFYLLDVISITGGSHSHLDPFTTANNVYLDTFGIKPGHFLKNTAPVPNPDDNTKVDHDMTITLLPHQIIIFPRAILANLDIDPFTEDNTNMELYHDDEIRYYIIYTNINKYFNIIFLNRELVDDPDLILTLVSNSVVEVHNKKIYAYYLPEIYKAILDRAL